MKLSNKRYWILLFCFFVVGGYVWKVNHSGLKPLSLVEQPQAQQVKNGPYVLAEISGKPVTSDELEFEYHLLTFDLHHDAELKTNDKKKDKESNLEALREEILSSIVERKMLFTYLQQDNRFNINDPARFTACLAEWQAVQTENPAVLKGPRDVDFLKARLCEKSMIDQYLQEVVFKDVDVSDKEINKYYQENQKKFVRPERITIRQIVLASENEAKSVRAGLNKSNFAARAREFSITPEAENGGLLGPYSRSELPRIFDIAFQMRRGDIYGILKSTYGFHLIMLDGVEKKVELSKEEAKEDIVAVLAAEKKEKKYQQWVDAALNSIEVKPPKPLW